MEENKNHEVNDTPEAEVASEAEEVSSKPELAETVKKGALEFVDIIETTIITIFIIVLAFTYLIHPVNVVGESMVPTLNNNDRLFMSMIPVGIKNGDIIVIDNDVAYLMDSDGNVYKADPGHYNECIIKRVIATEGQTVNINDAGEVFVNNNKIDEPYINSFTENDGAFTYPLTVPEGYCFVMGDNRLRSADSRDRHVGLIKEEQIYGKAVFRYSPEMDIL